MISEAAQTRYEVVNLEYQWSPFVLGYNSLFLCRSFTTDTDQQRRQASQAPPRPPHEQPKLVRPKKVISDDDVKVHYTLETLYSSEKEPVV